MAKDSPNLLKVVEGLLARRAALLAEVAQIDARLRQAEVTLLGGASAASPSAEQPTEAIDAVASWVAAKVDGRRTGTMVEWIIKTLKAHPEGFTRLELKALVGGHPVFGPKLRRNENGFYNAVKRLSDRGEEVVSVGGRLYATEHAPSAEDPPPGDSGIVSLFGRGGGNG